MAETVCVDLNGVLDTYAGWQGEVTWHPPRDGARAFLASLCERGYRVVVLTVRYPDHARQWLEEHGLDGYVSDVTNQKPPALAYVDDRAVCFRGTFEDTLRELDEFAPHWRRAAAGDDTDGERRSA